MTSCGMLTPCTSTAGSQPWCFLAVCVACRAGLNTGTYSSGPPMKTVREGELCGLAARCLAFLQTLGVTTVCNHSGPPSEQEEYWWRGPALKDPQQSLLFCPQVARLWNAFEILQSTWSFSTRELCTLVSQVTSHGSKQEAHPFTEIIPRKFLCVCIPGTGTDTLLLCKTHSPKCPPIPSQAS